MNYVSYIFAIYLHTKCMTLLWDYEGTDCDANFCTCIMIKILITVLLFLCLFLSRPLQKWLSHYSNTLSITQFYCLIEMGESNSTAKSCEDSRKILLADF